ncbi:hypothetical protein FRX31_008061 [Thalictrum thalictroides]|uniref:Uncharacterized protein n=1 Tax=Thalictrum thalictroides TaxID=46969 RepID=A0A7J6X1T6_THATH|nr:hypothetical protein FRX31_008061 [Thalictrum thalictroides]
MPKLPLEFFYPSLLKSIGNGLGTFVSIDRDTASLARPDVARICVEMDVQEVMQDKIWLESPIYGGFWQPLFYPNFLYCSHCSTIGHSNEHCRKKNQPLNENKINKGKNIATNPAPGNKGKDISTDPAPGNKENAQEQALLQVEPWKIKKVYKPTGKLFTTYPSSFTFESGEPSTLNASYNKATANENQHTSMPTNIPINLKVLKQEPCQNTNSLHTSPVKAYTPIQLTNSFALLNDPDKELESDKDLDDNDPIIGSPSVKVPDTDLEDGENCNIS